MAVIVLDPGHGGSVKVGGSSPNNAVGPTGLLEKTVVLQVARAAKVALERAGHTVIMTRNSDVNLGLADRARVARLARAVAFVSIHFNGYHKKVQGTETFIHSSGSSRSAQFCRAIQPRLVNATGYEDRNAKLGGVKRAGYEVLKPSNHFSGTAAVLIECSFMHLADEEARLRTQAYIDRLGGAVARGVIDFVGPAVAGAAMATADDAEVVAGGEDGYEALAMEGAAPMAVASASAAKPRRSKALAELEPDTVDEGETDDGGADDGGAMAAVAGAEIASTGDTAEFDKYIETLGLRYFKPHEMRFMGASNGGGACGGKNDLPPKAIWKNIANTALMLDEIRHRLDASVTILSTYRSPEYNKCIGGATKSLHMRFNAIDFKCAKGKPSDWRKVVDLVAKSDPRFQGYIGMYDTFIHIDTRKSL
jgi:N-acetylmuramoyl-L-alanine amidase